MPATPEFNGFSPDPSVSPAPHQPRHLGRWIFFGLVLVMLLSFVGTVVYYLWQFKYGAVKDVAKIQAEFQFSKLRTSVTATDDTAPVAPADLNSFVRAHNPVFGDPKARVTVLAFVDFECPFSRQSYPTVKAMANKFGPAVRVVFKQLPLTSLHANALAAAEASTCAADQGKFWEYHDRLFISQQLDREGLVTAAQTTGLELDTFNRCLEANPHRAELEADLQDAIALKVRGTPTYFVNHTVIEGVPDAARWDQVILSQLR